MKHNRVYQREKRHVRVRAVVSGTEKRPRISVYKSNTGLYIQLIDDDARKTIASVRVKAKNTNAALSAGAEIARIMKTRSITTAVFDRGGNAYHGVVAALGQAIRDAGIIL